MPLLSAFGLALIGVKFSYGGYHHATFVASEVIDAQRVVPRALLLGIAVVCLAYLTINVAYLRLLPIETIATSKSVAADAVSLVWAGGAKFIAFLIALSVLGTLGIVILTAPRIYFAMADDGLFFKQLAALHSRYKTPQYAIILQSLWAIVLLVFWQTFNNLIIFVVFVDAGFFFLTVASIFIFRKKLAYVEHRYKTFAYPITPILSMIVQGFIMVNTLILKPQEAGAGLVFLLIGTVFYYFFKKNQETTLSSK